LREEGEGLMLEHGLGRLRRKQWEKQQWRLAKRRRVVNSGDFLWRMRIPLEKKRRRGNNEEGGGGAEDSLLLRRIN
jgi:hypothetical protein